MAEPDDPGAKYLATIEPVWQKVSIYKGSGDFLKQFGQQPKELGYLFSAHLCQSEVRNGGFHQFFGNPTGVLAPEALLAFRAIQIPEWEDLLAEALKFFGEPYPRDQMERIQLLDKCTGETRKEWDPFYGLDDQFYAWSASDYYRWHRIADQYAAEFIKRN